MEGWVGGPGVGIEGVCGGVIGVFGGCVYGGLVGEIGVRGDVEEEGVVS